jgi:acyl dehydratase
VVVRPTNNIDSGVTQLVKYAAGGGDFNPLHHDFDFTQSKAIGSIIVHGRFKYAALGELVSNWLDHGGRIKKIDCQYRGMDLPNAEMTLGGNVKRKWEEAGEKLAELELYVKNEKGKNTTPGSAIVRFD